MAKKEEETTQLIHCVDVKGTKHLCTAKQLSYRPSVYGLVFRDNKMLVVDSKYGLSLPGGKIELGERHFTALEREVFEETNVRVTVGEICYCDTSFFTINGKHHHCICLFYLCEYKSGELSTKNLTPEEWAWDLKPFWLPIPTILDRGLALTADWRSALQRAQKML